MDLSKLNFGKNYKFQFKKENNNNYIFDEVRKKWLIITPEEWVRQNCIKYFREEKKISLSSILIERKLDLNSLSKRFDILILKKAQPFILVECKAPQVKITEKTFEQIARYNINIKAQYIFLTNGIEHYIFYFNQDKNNYSLVEDFLY